MNGSSGFAAVLKCFSLVALVLTLGVGNSSADEPQLWLIGIAQLNPDPVRLEILVHNRQESGVRESGLFLIQPRLSTKCHEYLRCALNYAYIARRYWDNDAESSYEQWNRFEGELSPGFSIAEGVRYNGRERFEYYTDTDFDYFKSRFRHRSLIEFDHVHDRIGVVTGGELIYNFETTSFEQYRLALPGARFDPGIGVVSVIPWLMFSERASSYHNTFVLWLDYTFDLAGD